MLVSCDPQGRLEPLMNKVKALNDKNKFDFLLMAGEVCDPRSSPYIASLRKSEQSLPLPTYFIDNSEMSPVLHKLIQDGTSIAPDLNFLGTSGIITVCKTTIAYFSHINDWSGDSEN